MIKKLTTIINASNKKIFTIIYEFVFSKRDNEVAQFLIY